MTTNGTNGFSREEVSSRALRDVIAEQVSKGLKAGQRFLVVEDVGRPIDVAPIADAVAKIEHSIALAISSIPKPKEADLTPLAKGLQALAEAVMEQGRQIAETNRIAAQHADALAQLVTTLTISAEKDRTFSVPKGAIKIEVEAKLPPRSARSGEVVFSDGEKVTFHDA